MASHSRPRARPQQVHFLGLAVGASLAMVGAFQGEPRTLRGGTTMTASHTTLTHDPVRTDCVTLARELGPRFAARAGAHDTADSFVAENYRDLRERRLFSAGVPAELGGGGASHA